MPGLTTTTKDLSKSFHRFKLITALSECKHDSVMGYAIRSGVENPEGWDQFILDLLSQEQDNPSIVLKVIGEKAYDLLVTY